jgi:hypothetical protein
MWILWYNHIQSLLLLKLTIGRLRNRRYLPANQQPRWVPFPLIAPFSLNELISDAEQEVRTVSKACPAAPSYYTPGPLSVSLASLSSSFSFLSYSVCFLCLLGYANHTPFRSYSLNQVSILAPSHSFIVNKTLVLLLRSLGSFLQQRDTLCFYQTQPNFLNQHKSLLFQNAAQELDALVHGADRWHFGRPYARP